MWTDLENTPYPSSKNQWAVSISPNIWLHNVFNLVSTISEHSPCKERYISSSCRKRGKWKNSESPWGIEPQTFGFGAPMLYLWATETMVSVAYYEVRMTRVLHIARISNVDSVMFVNKNSTSRFPIDDSYTCMVMWL